MASNTDHCKVVTKSEDPFDSALPFLRLNVRPSKPRQVGLTEVRGPFYDTFGPTAVEDILEVSGSYIDWFKIPGPALAIIPRRVLQRIVQLCHSRNILVSAGGLVEFVLTRDPGLVRTYFKAVADLGFDVIEVSAGMLAISDSDYLSLVQAAKESGMLVKAEVGIQFGAGGTSPTAALEAVGTSSIDAALRRARNALDVGAHMVILESEGVTEAVRDWRLEVPTAFAGGIGLERVMFEAADPQVYEWYIKSFGPDVNLFVDHSQVLHLEVLRSGAWGSISSFGRVVSYKGE